jgi:hypothetical protein
MGGILNAIEQSATSVVEAGEMNWRVRKISSGDLARVGHAALAVAQGLEQPKESAEDTEGASAEFIKQVASAPVKQLETMAKLKDAVVAAGLLAVGDPETGEWEEVRAVLDVDAGDAKSGRLWVGAIPSDIGDTLFAEIMSLSTDGGKALERLRSFRGTTGNTASAGPSRKKVRKAAK